MACTEKSLEERVNICVCVTDSDCGTPETNTTLGINYIPVKILKKRIASVGTSRNWERKAESFSESIGEWWSGIQDQCYTQELFKASSNPILADTNVQDRQAGGSAKSG